MHRLSRDHGWISFGLSALALAGLLLLSACGSSGLIKPTIAVELPEKYNTPDGMVLDADGNILLSIPNFNNDSFPAKIVKITKDNKIEEVYTMPLHPDTGKAGPLGLDIGSDGNIYVADNQAFGTDDYKSRLLRVNMKNGKAVGCDVLVTGFIMSNAVACHGDSVYVTETKLDVAASPLPSGVYKFKYSELKGNNPIQLRKGGLDSHLILTLHTENTEWAVGANGLGFSPTGAMYVCNFGDAQIIKVTFDQRGAVASKSILAEGSGMLSADGLKVDQKTGEIYVADFLGNAVHKVHPDTGEVTTLAKNGNTTGKGGKLDKCSEVCLRDGKVYVSNIDLQDLDGNTFDVPHSISVIDLSKSVGCAFCSK